MTPTKEKNRLNMLLVSGAYQDIDVYDDKNMEILNEHYREYAAIIGVLYKKHPNVFGNLYNHQLREIKDNKMSIKKSFSELSRQENFTAYKHSIKEAVEVTVDYINDYI